MIYLSLSRLLVLTIFFAVIRSELKNYCWNKANIRFNLGAFFILTLGEVAVLISSIWFNGRMALDYPIRNFFEIIALLFLSYACNFEFNKLNRQHLRNVKIGYFISFFVPLIGFFVFDYETGKLIIYGAEVIIFSKFIINSTSKIDNSIEKQEIIVIGFSLFLFLSDLFFRLWHGYVSILLTASLTGFCIAFLLYTIRANRKVIDKEISTKDREINIFAEVTKKLNSTFNLNQLLNSFIKEICEILDAQSGAIYLYEKNTDSLICEALYGFYPPIRKVNERAMTKLEYLHKAVKSMPVYKNEGLVGRVFARGKSEILRDLDKNKDFVQTIQKVSVSKTIITMPLLREDQVYGVLQIVNKNDGENFTDNDFRFADMIVDQASLAIHNAFMIGEMRAKQETDTDLKAAREIQRSLIPNRIPENKMLDIAAVFSPTRQIGGDYYDFIKIDQDHIGVIIADVSGKGVTGGLVMSVMRTIMRMVSINSYSPKSVLTELNHGIEIAVKEKHMFITAIYCIFNTKERLVKICRAGHNPFVICRKEQGDIKTYKPDGIALGIVDSSTFERLTKEIEVTYEPGDNIFLYTDGVVEEFDPKNNMFGDVRLHEYLVKKKDENSASIIKGLEKELKEFRSGFPQHDDIAMINIKTF